MAGGDENGTSGALTHPASATTFMACDCRGGRHPAAASAPLEAREGAKIGCFTGSQFPCTNGTGAIGGSGPREARGNPEKPATGGGAHSGPSPAMPPWEEAPCG